MMSFDKPIRRIAIVGTGVIGASWAAQYLARGFDVVATDPAPNAEANLRKYVDDAWPAVSRMLEVAAIGLAGITAYAVAQRRREIAIRTALGATRSQVLRLVLREGAALVSVGTVLGFLGAVAIAKILSALTSIFVQAFKVGTGDLG